MKNYIIILLFFISTYSICSAQTYIKPLIGKDYTRLESALSKLITIDNFSFTRNYYITNAGFNFNSNLIGVKIERQLSSKFSLSLTSQYTRKEVGAFVNGGIVGYNGFRFDYFRNQLSFNYHVIDFLFLGIGGNVNVLSNFRPFKDSNDYIGKNLEILLREFGIHGLIGFHFKNIELELFYLHNLTTHDDDSGMNLKPIRSFGANLGYKIKL